jgi:hypothetical protein
MARADFYLSTTTTTSYVSVPFGFVSNRIQVIPDDNAAEDIQISWDGTTLAGDIKAGEPFRPDEKEREEVFIRSASGGVPVRIWAF